MTINYLDSKRIQGVSEITTTVNTLTNVIFDTLTEIGDLTYSGNVITRSADSYFRHGINANFQFNNTGTQTIQCVAQNIGTSAWFVFGLATAKTVDVGSTGDASSQMQYCFRKADDNRTWIRQSSGAFTQVSNTDDNATFKITNDRTTVTYYVNGSSVGATTHATPNAKYYPMMIIAQTGVDGSYAFTYSGNIIQEVTKPTNVQTNSIFEETDNSIRYWYDGTTWIDEFLPSDISALYSWHDASDLSTITKYGNNTVSQWNDKSGNSKNFTASGTEPLWISASQNGKDVIDTIGSKYMSYPLTVQAQPITICIASQIPTDANGYGMIFRAGNSPYMLYGHSATDQLTIASITNQYLNEVGIDGTWQSSIIVFNGSSSALYLNDISKITGNTGTTGLDNASFYLGVNANNSNLYSNTKYGEILIYAKELNSTERMRINRYFINKWGL